MRTLIIGAVLSLVSPSAALAEIATPSVPAMSAANQADQAEAKKIVCRSVPVTGSRFPERQCAPKSAWAKQEEEARRAGHEVLDRAVVNTSRGN